MGSSAPPNVADSIITSPSTTTTTTSKNILPPETTLPTGPPSNTVSILHLGDPIQHNLGFYEQLRSRFHIIRPPPEDLERSVFIKHLKERTWGDFSAVMRPFWRSGNTMKPWNEELIELLPETVQVMAGAGAGYDWVDDRCLAEHGIIYCNGAHASTESVADTAIWHIISVFRHMTASSLAARSGSATRWNTAHNAVPSLSHNPSKHTLGIVGLGNIGFAIAKKARRAFDMTILYTDIVRKSAAQEHEVDATFYPEMTDMLPHCDCILLATPAGPSLLTASTIPLLPRGARVVNIARGNLIDEDALADALDSGHLDAAGLDVHEHEPQVHPRLARMDNVELTSHTGGGSVETNIGFELLSMQNCEAVLDGRDPLTAVNLRWLQPKEKKVKGQEQVGASSSVDVVLNGQSGEKRHHDHGSEKPAPGGFFVGADETHAETPAGTRTVEDIKSTVVNGDPITASGASNPPTTIAGGTGAALPPSLEKEMGRVTAPVSSSGACATAVANDHPRANGNDNVLGVGNGVENGSHVR